MSTVAPKRIRLSRARGWRLADYSTNYVIVDRRGAFGNPWTVHPSGKHWVVRRGDGLPFVGVFDTQAEAQACAVGQFRRWLTDDAFAATLPEMGRSWILDHLDDLRGKDLCCWCGEGLACHVSVYFEVLAGSNGGTP